MYSERERQTAAKREQRAEKKTFATRALAALARGYPRARSQTFFPNYTVPEWCNKKLKIKTQCPRSVRRGANHYPAKVIQNQ